jgi:subtilase family serine protease
MLSSPSAGFAAATHRARRGLIPVLALASFITLTAHAESWVNTATQAIPLAKSVVTTPLSSAAAIHVAVGLTPQNKAVLDAFVKSASTPGNAAYGSSISAAEFLAKYSPTAAQLTQVEDYLSDAGFTNIKASANRLMVTADGTAGVAETAFNTKLVQFLAGGSTVFANITPAQVPAALNGIVSGVLGLHNVGSMHTQLELDRLAGVNDIKPIPAKSLPAITIPSDPLTDPFFDASMFQTAYDAAGVTTGYGTTVGIISEGDLTQLEPDLRQYEKENNLPQVPLQIIYKDVESTDTSGLDEFDLDSQSSSGIAGNLRQIIMYAAPSLDDADLTADIERAVSDDLVKEINMSIGGCETLEYLDGAMLLDDIAIEAGAAEGISFFTSSGDGGASCQLLINAGEPVLLGMVEYPASSPYAIGVGGTSLFITDTSGDYDFEIGWISGGGGNSLWETAPSWTTSVVPLANSTLPLGLRGVPDMAMDADNNLSPADVVVNGADEGVGGTSLASPLAMGSFARMQSAHGECYGFIAPTLYSYAPGLLKAAAGFHDIVLGFNFLYLATPGWDYVTGLGSFDIAKVSAELPAVSCAPEAPFQLAAAPSGANIALSWTGSPGASSYSVYAGTASGDEAATPVATGVTGTSTTVTGLPGGQTYYFVVKAVNAKGASPASNEASAEALGPPAAPTLTATAETKEAALSWTTVPGATQYRIYEAKAPGGAMTFLGSTPGTKGNVPNLTTGSTYYFTVKAFDAAGAGPASNVASVTAK